jgi:membrane-associated tyrosine/threonine-specific cdc2-inhibitory kinase
MFAGCDGICKLGDFGLIVDLTNHSQSGWREGDSKYLAPEVLKGVVTKVGLFGVI